MQIERTENEIIIRIPAEMDSYKMQEVLNLLRYGELTSKSSAIQEEVDHLASEINLKWWKENRDRFLK